MAACLDSIAWRLVCRQEYSQAMTTSPGAETLVGPGVGTPLPVGTGGGPGYLGGSYGGPSSGPVIGMLPASPALLLKGIHRTKLSRMHIEKHSEEKLTAEETGQPCTKLPHVFHHLTAWSKRQKSSVKHQGQDLRGIEWFSSVGAGPQLLQQGGLVTRSTQTAKPVLYVLPDCLYTIPASKPCSGPSSVGCSIPGQCTSTQLPGGCCQIGFKCT